VIQYSKNLAYVIGVALGDGNLSNPNGRAVRLRITLDNRYPKVIEEVIKNLKIILPENKISIVNRSDNCLDVSVYSNKLTEIIPWEAGSGSKIVQRATIPNWIKSDLNFTKHCLKGLLQTDGSIYFDRNYKMVNFTNNIKNLVQDTKIFIETLGYQPKFYVTKNKSGSAKYTVRLTKNVDNFIREINLVKE
jgi:hypothetical protein